MHTQYLVVHCCIGVTSCQITTSVFLQLDNEHATPEIQMKQIQNLTCGLQQQLGLDLFGVDVIVENHTGRYGVIDINAFPGG